jgi:GlpG protein
MRRIGVLEGQASANDFSHYLRQQGIENRVDPADGKFELWLFDEDRLTEAREKLARFEAGDLIVEPKPIIKAPPPKRRPVVRRRQSFRPPIEWPVTLLLMIGGVIVTALTHFGDPFNAVTQEMYIVGVKYVPFPVFETLRESLRHGEIWRLVTPMFIHMSLLHIGLNLQWIYVFGCAIERVRGSWRLLGLVIFSAVCSNVGQYELVGPQFGGLSGVGHAMFGYVWMKAQFFPETGFLMPRSLFWSFWLFFGFCFTGILPIANVCHTVGLVIGVLYGLSRKL